MNNMKYFITTILCFGLMTAFAFRNPESAKPAKKNTTVEYRMNCAQASRQTDLDINNVRARLLVGGDVWWDGNNGRYIVPNVEPGEVEVSSIFAGAVWLGGIDPGGNLKIAAQQFGTASGASDFWPGPLTEEGFVDDETCANWDNFFTVTGAEIDLHISRFLSSQEPGADAYTENDIPAGVKTWPGLGNQFFFEEFGFELPTAEQGLGAFFDENGDNLYNPLDGDYPIIEIRGCVEPQYPDEMKFWIYNDAGNIHTESNGDAIQMEVQVQAFAYSTNDELNNMTFSRYKLINRAVETIDSTFFAMWVDADLGCSEDDYIGTDTTRSLMYIYNTDAVDGSSGTNCTNGVETYGNSVPYLGVDYFRGPLAPKIFGPNGELINPGRGQEPDTLVEIGMTSFLYFNRASPTTDPAQIDPRTAQEYYNYLTGTWRTGAVVTEGGSGIGGSVPTKFVFPDEPNNTNGWSMCTAELPLEDRRTIQASGPFRLDPGQVNELIIGVPWVPNVTYPCPDMGRLFRADDIAQGLFNSCFDIVDGPDAPDANWVELDQKIIGVLSNEPSPISNNGNLAYQELDPLAPTGLDPDSASFVFEGYLVYQLSDLDVAIDELDNPDKARLVFQSDIANEASTIYNWNEVENVTQGPLDPPTVFVPELQVEGENTGVRTTFELTQDVFSGDPLINHTTYYFTAIAYAYNQYEPFSTVAQSGQATPYLEGRRNIRTYSVTPRPIADRNLNANYGDGAVITRLDGTGAGGNFLLLSDEERTRIFNEQVSDNAGGYTGAITYEPGGGPVTIQVIDPLRVRDGDYVIRFDQSAALETGDSSWSLFDFDTNENLGNASQTLKNQNEELFPDLGFSVTIQQSKDAGVDATTGDPLSPNNGAIGQTITYADPLLSWLTPVADNAPEVPELAGFDLHFQPTNGGELNGELDPEQDYTNLGSGHFAPYTLMDWTVKIGFYATPAWLSSTSRDVQPLNPVSSLNNVDVVYTSDKSKWSRCVVVETGNSYFTEQGFELDDNNTNFDVVDRPSVSKEDNDGDGRPDPDNSGTTGFAWFPGYAIDVETGVRVNIFFGENSAYGDNTVLPDVLTEVNGSDMMFNPSDQALVLTQPPFNAFNLGLGGMHYMYVTKQPYDECAAISESLRETLSFRRIPALREISWAGIGLKTPGVDLLSYADGLIPTETVVSLRVDNPYNTELGTNDNATFPSYEFKIEGLEAGELTTEDEINNQLDMINVVPNPYLGYSNYEVSQFNNTVKITNLPAKCVVTIYSLDGQFIRQYNRDEVEIPNSGANSGLQSSQINPAIEWDLRNSAAIPVSSGVYLIHVAAEGLGERVIKWFGVNRQFDPSGL
jgi:hypothetical protein